MDTYTCDNSYTCDNCKDPSDTLISHPWVTGQTSGFCLKCFRIMASILKDLKKHCPVCRFAVHELDCVVRLIGERDAVEGDKGVIQP